MANVKFFSQAIDDYTLTVTSEATGYEKENMQDRRKDTSWKATSATAQNIDIDRGSGTLASFDYVFLYHNISNNHTVQIFSATLSDYSDEASISDPAVINNSTRPNLNISTTADNKRYWRIKIQGAIAAPEVYLVFMGVEHEITIRYMMGQLEDTSYAGSRVVESLGGIRASRQYYPGRKVWQYAWEYLDQTNKNNLQSLINQSKGKALPFFMADIDGNYHYVRLMNDMIGSREAYHSRFNTDVLIFEEEF